MKEIEYYGKKFYAKVCPCCGGEAKLETTTGTGMGFCVYIECDNCGLRTKNMPVAPHYSAIEIVVDLWNKRAEEEE